MANFFFLAAYPFINFVSNIHKSPHIDMIQMFYFLLIIFCYFLLHINPNHFNYINIVKLSMSTISRYET